MESYYTLNPNEVVISEEEQQKIREADYYGGKKCIVYYKDEQFKPYPKNENYIVGNYGSFYSTYNKTKCTPYIDKYGYAQYHPGKSILIQKAILETFNPVENSDKLKVTHIDGNRQNNVYDPENNRVNLSWYNRGQNPYRDNQIKMDLTEENQQKIRESDAIKQKKTIAYIKNEKFKIHPIQQRYVVGNHGTIFSLENKKKLNLYIDKDGYEHCHLGKDYMVHRAIMETFSPNKESKYLQVNHIDCNKTNNVYDPEHGKVNLEWCTVQENIAHAIAHGLRYYQK